MDEFPRSRRVYILANCVKKAEDYNIRKLSYINVFHSYDHPPKVVHVTVAPPLSKRLNAKRKSYDVNPFMPVSELQPEDSKQLEDDDRTQCNCNHPSLTSQTIMIQKSEKYLILNRIDVFRPIYYASVVDAKYVKMHMKYATKPLYIGYDINAIVNVPEQYLSENFEVVYEIPVVDADKSSAAVHLKITASTAAINSEIKVSSAAINSKIAGFLKPCNKTDKKQFIIISHKDIKRKNEINSAPICTEKNLSSECKMEDEINCAPVCTRTELPTECVMKKAYMMCNSSSLPTQFSTIGNSIIKPGIPKLSAHAVSDDVTIRPVILHPTKQLSPQVHMKSDTLIKTIGFSPSRSLITSQPQSRIVTPSLQRSIMESQNVSPLIITPTPHVIHTSNEIVPAKIVPIPSAPTSHFSVINKPVSYDSIPEYTGIRQSMVSGTPPVYTQSDFARFPPKTYHHKSAVINPAVIHGPITGNIEESCINIPNSQHVFKPIISPRPSILRKRDADGVLRAQKNLIPILTKPDIEECHADDLSQNRNGYSESGLQIESIMVPQNPDVILPQISALSRKSHIMVEISPRKKPRKQLLPVNQDSPFKLVSDEMEYVDEKIIKNDKIEEYPDEDVNNCNDDLPDGDAEDEAEDDLEDNRMDVDNNCPADDDYDENDDEDDDFGNVFGDGFDFGKPDKNFYEEVKTPVEVSDESSIITKNKNKRPTLLGGVKNTYRGHSHHFQKYTDYKSKESKKQLGEMQQAKKWVSDSKCGWRVRHLLKEFDGMMKTEEEVIAYMDELLCMFEVHVENLEHRHTLNELAKCNIQRSKVARGQLEEIIQQLSKVFDLKTIIEDVVDKYCPKELKKKYTKVFSKT